MQAWALWIKALHIFSVIAWMAGLFYLPRLFVYHASSSITSQSSETFKIMERRLLKGIMNPAMIFTWGSGLYIATAFGYWKEPWLHAKLALVIILSGFHGYLVGRVRAFSEDRNEKSERYYRIINEFPTLILIGILILVVIKPF